MTVEDLNEIQRIDTEILFNVVDICEKYEIPYYLMYGTLLGAVRHSGPIPWDDDVDIAMTRENYFKFLKVVDGELDARNEVHVMGSGEIKYITELKIGRKGSCIDLPGTENLNIMHQIQLDVFILDYIRNYSLGTIKVLDLLKKVLMTAKLCWDEKVLIMHFIDKGQRKGKLLYKILLSLSHLIRMLFGEKNIEKFLYKIYVDETETSKNLGVVSPANLKIWSVDDFLETMELEYDGRKLKVARGYKNILKDAYGDYMKLPPEEKRFRKYFNEYVLKVGK